MNVHTYFTKEHQATSFLNKLKFMLQWLKQFSLSRKFCKMQMSSCAFCLSWEKLKVERQLFKKFANFKLQASLKASTLAKFWKIFQLKICNWIRKFCSILFYSETVYLWHKLVIKLTLKNWTDHGLFLFFVLFLQQFYKICRLNRDSNSNRKKRWRACWPLNNHQRSPIVL